jgi:multidrug efflux pump subunit AcrB
MQLGISAVAALPKIKTGLPSALTLTPIFDQSVLVRASIRDVAQELTARKR